MYSYKLLKHLKIKWNYPLEQINQWPSYLPEKQIDIVLQNKTYNEKRFDYMTKGPYIWLAIQMYHNQPFSLEKIWKIYQQDEQAQELQYFQNFEQFQRIFISPLKQKQRIIPMITKQEGYNYFHGFKINQETGLSIIDPQVLLTHFHPTPKTSTIKMFSKILKNIKKQEKYNEEQQQPIDNQLLIL